MKITFCVHGCAIKPIGGHKIIYEYANRLAEAGHTVHVVFVSYDNLYQLPLTVGIRVGLLRILTDKTRILPGWFQFNPQVNIRTVRDYQSSNFPDADAVIATAAETANPVAQLPERCGSKFYLIQDYETWTMEAEKVDDTFCLGLTPIVVSNWLAELVEKKSSAKAFIVSNPINLDVFHVSRPIEQRMDHTIGLLWHADPKKGLKTAFGALEIAHQQFPDLRVKVFGATKPNQTLPRWMEFVFRPAPDALQKLYNSCSIYLCATEYEGFGLTGAESMACGCLLVSTNYLGVHEYAKDRSNALLSNVGDAQALANHIKEAFQNPALRIQLASQGAKDLQKRRWTIAVQKFERILQETTEQFKGEMVL